MMTSMDFQLLRAGITEVFMQTFQKPSFYERIFNVRNSQQEYEEFLSIVGLPNLIEWNSDGGELPMVKAIQGTRVVFVHRDYGYMWSLSKRLLRGNQYLNLSAELTRSAAQAAQYTVEALATAVIASGFTVAGADGVPLFSTDHPLMNGSTYSNRLGAALSKASLQDAITRFRRAVNHRGQPITIEPRYLIVPPELEFTAKELINSSVVVAQGGSGFSTNYTNVLQGIAEVVVNPYLIDTNDWFLFADKGDHKLMLFWREKPNITTDRDFRTQGISSAINMALSVGYVDWMGLVGSSVA
ncbi:MAG: Mu-like prophage major head subunit gpT family protein [Candidatus Caldarchaeum sp.]